MTKRQYITVDLAEVRQRVADGADSRVIAAEVGMSPRSVYRLCDKAGIPIRGRKVRSASSLRSAIQDMRPLDALEYVLEAYEVLTGHLVDIPDVGLSSRETQIFQMMQNRAGEIVSSEAIMAMMEATNPDLAASLNLLHVHIKHIRKKLAGRYRIVNVRAVGYTLERVA